MAHRGPDDEGFESLPMGSHEAAGVAAFGFRRLAILDLTETGHQPMVHPTTGDCLVFNGEIYNYRWIRARLQSEGVRIVSTGDSEVLLKALTSWGEAAIGQLDGMFSFAFYEARTRRVLLSRDPVGIKPLYVAESSAGYFFASEIRMLLASGVVPDDYDPAGIASYLAYGSPQDPLTIHSAVKVFPSGTSQWIHLGEAGEVKKEPRRQYWQMPEAMPHRSMDEATVSLRTTLRASVREHLASDVPLAFFLSGGIDSAAIAALATEELGRVSTYSVGFESPGMPSELPAAAETAGLLGSDHHEVMIGRREIAGLWEAWLDAADRPSVDGLNTYIITKAVRSGNAKVAFSGIGADELFGGYANFFRVQKLVTLTRLLSVAPLSIRLQVARLLLPLCPPRYRARLMMLARARSRPVDLTFSIRQMLEPAVLHQLGFEAGQLGLDDLFLPPELLDRCGRDARDVFRAVCRAELYGYMGNTLLRDADVNSMAHSIELRVPFVGRRVLEEAARSPGNLHLDGGRTPKAILRRAVSGFVPPAILARPKTGFTLPVGDWMYEELNDSCEAAIDALQRVPFLNATAARAQWNSMKTARSHTYWMKPLLLVALGSYVDRQSRTYADNAGAVKVRPASRPNATNSV